MAICDQSDVESLIGVTFTNQPEPRVTDLINKATAVLAGWLGQTYDGATVVETFDGSELDNRYRLYLTVAPDTVTSVVESGTTLTVTDDYTINGNVITRVSGGYPWVWAAGYANIAVTYTTPAEAPDDVRLVAAGMVARLFITRQSLADGGLARAGITSERIGRYAVTYDTDGELQVNGNPTLTTADMLTLSQSGARPPGFA